jgi:hypothetical protein
MSAFLGKIHYLLYDKIQLQEYLYQEMIELAKKENIDLKDYILTLEEAHGRPLSQPLEDIIDHKNIHGSLQNFIHSVETRQAEVTLKAIESGLSLNSLIEIYRATAYKRGQLVYNPNHSPYQIFTGIYSHLLDGMPCDRVNQVLENEEDHIVWETQTCLHERYWKNQVDIYYLLTDSFIRGFIEGASEAYTYVRKGNQKKVVKK